MIYNRQRILTALIATGFVLYCTRTLYISWTRRLPDSIAIPTASPEHQQIPNKIWYNVRPPGLTDEMSAWIQTCLELNPEAEPTFMTDASGDEWVARVFADHAAVVQTYLNFSIPILKADLLRYLLIFAEGGVYFDLDITCHIPFQDWIPDEYRSDVNLLVGWEFDVGWGENIVREFVQWTFLAKPRSPHLWAVILEIVDFFEAKRLEFEVDSIAELTPAAVGDVVDATGPRMFTKSILKSLGKTLELDGPVDPQTIKNLQEPRLVGDVLILPGFAFAAESNHWPADWVLTPPLITHHGMGSWKHG